MSIHRSLPAGIPRWAARRPLVAAALLGGRNVYHRNRTLLLLGTVLLVVAACGLAALPQVALVLGWLGRNVVVTFVLAICLFGLSTIRRRERAAVTAASSWLAALPAPSSVSLKVLAGTGARVLLLVLFTLLAMLFGRLDADSVWRLALAVAVGAGGGSLAGWRLRRAADDDTPGFHYATVRRARPRWAAAPTLLPLSYWPAAQGRIFSRPKMVSRVAFIALMTVPLGTPGQVALAIAAGAIATFSIVSLSLAAIRVAFAAARWLAPTTLRRRRFTTAIVWRVLLTQALSLAVMVFLACAIDLPRALRLGVALASGFLAVSLAAAALACGCASLRIGLGAVSRGQ